MRSFSDLPVELVTAVLELVVADADDDFVARKQLAELALLSRRTRAIVVPLLYRTVEITHGNRGKVFDTAHRMTKLFTEHTRHLFCELTLSTPAEVHPQTVIDAFCHITRFSGCYQAFAVLAVHPEYKPKLVFLLDRASYRFTDYAVRGAFANVTHLHLVFRPSQVAAQPISSLTPRLTHFVLDADVPREEDMLLFIRDVRNFLLRSSPLQRLVVRTVRVAGGVKAAGLKANVAELAEMMKDRRLCIDDSGEAREHTHDSLRMLMRQDVRADQALFEEGAPCWNPPPSDPRSHSPPREHISLAYLYASQPRTFR
ncbi:hypothetical protein EXIGLDRAFT_836910 [Exidia glandulosa HHB12029]|uniref:F-box domain-containing protein n=1 Tax=Exidia glandulosa HHB12029 TaxID=1314781 RepID=A0A165HAY8_EXIGL|nr:hypothetical protein EXIGLDRAFT_836910 [Exidia glandulosa HHB12029]